MNLAYLVSDLQRRLANIVRRGKVHSVDLSAEPPLCRVEYQEGAMTGWLPWVSGRAGSRRDWEPVTVGERVIVLSESGEMANGVVIAGLNNSSYPVPKNTADEHVTRYDDGTEVVYNRAQHKLSISIGGGGDAHLSCKTFYINADIEHSGNQHSTGDIASDKDVSDAVRSMSDDRDIYNGHGHPAINLPPIQQQ